MESAKDAWNAEVAGVVRRAQSVDWAGVRGNAEGAVVALWRTIFGSPPPDPAELAGAVSAKASAVAKGAKEGALGMADAARDGFKDATGAATGSKVARELLDQGRQKGAEISQKVGAAVERGVDKVMEAVDAVEDTVRAATGTASPTAAAAMEGKKLSDVERALQQRFDRDKRKGAHSVKEALAERYKPIGERDNTMLRGL